MEAKRRKKRAPPIQLAGVRPVNRHGRGFRLIRKAYRCSLPFMPLTMER